MTCVALLGCGCGGGSPSRRRPGRRRSRRPCRRPIRRTCTTAWPRRTRRSASTRPRRRAASSPRRGRAGGARRDGGDGGALLRRHASAVRRLGLGGEGGRRGEGGARRGRDNVVVAYSAAGPRGRAAAATEGVRPALSGASGPPRASPRTASVCVRNPSPTRSGSGNRDGRATAPAAHPPSVMQFAPRRALRNGGRRLGEPRLRPEPPRALAAAGRGEHQHLHPAATSPHGRE